MKRNYFLLCLFFISLVAAAGDIKYPVSSIPEKLLQNADVVKREESVQFEFINTGETILRHKYVLTILNENGNQSSVFYESYDKLKSVESVDGYLYDVNGNLLKKMRSKDIKDFSNTDNSSLMDDNRAKMYNFYFASYPYTVEYEVVTKLKHSLYFPSWEPIDRERMSVENSTFTVITPADYKIRYQPINYIGDPAIKIEKNRRTLEWKISGLKAVEIPFASPPWSELVTSVVIAPTGFEVQGYKGIMDSWKDMGKFQYSLNSGRDQLPENIIDKVKQLTKGIIDDHEKVKVLYEFLQKSTRYISIQLGIGGWQPFDAAFVAKNGYGDCKALSNYMYSLLKAAGIKSHYTLVRAGENANDRYMLEDFPSRQSNHVIVCVPLQKDTMWLECTSQSVPAGYMGEFTGNRKALVIDANGGTLVSTPRYGLKENTQVRSIKAKLEADGTLKMNTTTTYKGVQQDDLSGMIDNLSKEKVKKHLEEDLALATYEINDFKYNKKKDVIPEVQEQLDVTVSNYATISGKRIFITPNILERGGARISEEEGRIVDFVFDYEFRNEDNEEIEIPEGYTIEAAPQDVSINTKYGSYYSSAKVIGSKIVYRRVREQFRGRFAAKEQKEIIKFFDDIYKADRSRFVLVKKPS